jgi:hypothetical protein
MKCNFDLKVNRNLIIDVEFFSFLEDDFKTDVDLRVACLILDKQVKLINGNEANILIPQNWMKKFLEDQENGIDRQNPVIVETIEIPSINRFILFSFSYFLSLI